MALSDLSLVTNSFLNLLRYRLNVGLFPIWKSATLQTLQDIDGQLKLSALPGDMSDSSLRLRLSLYHVTEDAHLKNQPPVSSGPVPVRNNPMGLQLYYQLTVHKDAFDALDEASILSAQTIFGLAI